MVKTRNKDNARHKYMNVVLYSKVIVFLFLLYPLWNAIVPTIFRAFSQTLVLNKYPGISDTEVNGWLYFGQVFTYIFEGFRESYQFLSN